MYILDSPPANRELFFKKYIFLIFFNTGAKVGVLKLAPVSKEEKRSESLKIVFWFI